MIKVALATVHNTLGKNKRALAIYAQLLGLASDPGLLDQAHKDADKLREEGGLVGLFADSFISVSLDVLVLEAFTGFVSSGVELDELPLAGLHEVLDDGLHFLQTIGHPEWGYGIHLERAFLYKEEGRTREALKEAQIALAMRRATPDGPGMYPEFYLCSVGNYLNDLRRYEEAISNFEAALNSVEPHLNIQRRAYHGLGTAYLGQGKLDLAEEMANQVLARVDLTENPVPLRSAYDLLSSLLARQGRIEEATATATRMSYTARQLEGPFVEYPTYLRCGEVRLEQALTLLQLSLDSDAEIPDALDRAITSNTRHRAKHYVQSAQRWFARARYPAARLDSRAATKIRQERLDTLRLKADQIIALTTSTTTIHYGGPKPASI